MEPLDPHADQPDPEDQPEDQPEGDANGVSHDASQGEAGTDEPAYPGAGERDVPTAPTTGDAVVDAAMIELAAAEAGSLAERIDAGERAHRVLQGRLSDLGGA
ncbi:hypothetical protein FHX52_1348 [Humibacillus xanthopallidus]|uniref:Uncharacterized protein n=2 Tax=Humibacillus xanthopallidus TaxID=412689 RepID=A0A543PVX2_9MICO|nr:hypothetical protein FHX52_1348 [Humibacillus xanthopallidus]